MGFLREFALQLASSCEDAPCPNTCCPSERRGRPPRGAVSGRGSHLPGADRGRPRAQRRGAPPPPPPRGPGARPRPLPARGAPAPLSLPGGLRGALYSHPGLGFALMRNVINPEKRAEGLERRKGHEGRQERGEREARRVWKLDPEIPGAQRTRRPEGRPRPM